MEQYIWLLRGRCVYLLVYLTTTAMPPRKPKRKKKSPKIVRVDVEPVVSPPPQYVSMPQQPNPYAMPYPYPSMMMMPPPMMYTPQMMPSPVHSAAAPRKRRGKHVKTKSPSRSKSRRRHRAKARKKRKHRSRDRPISFLPDFSSVLQQLAPYICCGGIAVLVLYLLFTFLSDAVCSFVTGIPLIGGAFDNMCGGDADLSLDGLGNGAVDSAGSIGGNLLTTAADLQKQNINNMKDLITGGFTSWP